MTESVSVGLGKRSYDILIGEGLLANIGTHLRPLLTRPRVAVFMDRNVQKLHGSKLMETLERNRVGCDFRTVPNGEAAKSWAVLQESAEWLIEIGMERQDLVMALGGGAVGDLAGFAAAIVHRGLRCVQIPTTLLAQVDSSIGGKTGINSDSFGKNLIGAFHQPSMVLCDVSLLATLNPRLLLAGYGEVAKYGLLGDAEFYSWLEISGPRIMDGDAASLIRAVRRSCEIKAEIVAADETETGRRALLNLGHTFAHALEFSAGYSDALLHGEAVAVGCCLAFDLSHELGLLKDGEADRVRRHFRSMQMRTDIGQLPTVQDSAQGLAEAMSRDKKAVNGKPRFVLARSVGDAFVSDGVCPDAVLHVLKRSMAEVGG